MAKREIKHPDKQVNTGAYSAGLEIDGWVYVSGQGPLDMQTGKIVGEDVASQTRLTLEHVQKILSAAGCSMDDVIKCTCHLANIEDFGAFNTAYSKFFQGVRPTRTTVQSALARGMLVEIDAVARVPG